MRIKPIFCHKDLHLIIICQCIMKWIISHKKTLQSRIQHRENVLERLGRKNISDWDNFEKKLYAQEIKNLNHYNDLDRKTLKKLSINNY